MLVLVRATDRKKANRHPKRGMRVGRRTESPHARAGFWSTPQKERKKIDNPREGWEDGTPPPHRDFKERGVVR